MQGQSDEKVFPIIARYAHKEDEHPDGWDFTLCGGHHGFNGYGILTRPSPYILPEGNVQISFSGGRTSAYMLHQILEANNGLPGNTVVCFQNTGREMPETLDFVQECSERWSVPIVWLEYDITSEGKNYFKVVSHNQASRNGEPFDKLINKYGRLPSARMRFCTGVLKIQTGQKYFKSLGWEKWYNAIGIRADEANRIKQDPKSKVTNLHPLADANKSKFDVAAFWKSQPFDLRLPLINGKTIKGNCDFCFLKSEASLAMMMKEHPDMAQWWIDAEKRTGKRFERRRSLKNFQEFVNNQQDWVFDQQGYFCQEDGGECTG